MIPLGVLGVPAMCLPFVPGVGADGQRRQGVDPARLVQPPAVGVPQAGRRRVRRRPPRPPPATTLVDVRAEPSCRSRSWPACGAGALPRPGRPRLGDRAGAPSCSSVALIAGVPLSPMLATGAGRRRRGRRCCSSCRARVGSPASRRSRHRRGSKDHLAYQIYQGYLSIADGGLTGSGIGGGKGKLGYLPSPTATSSSP